MSISMVDSISKGVNPKLNKFPYRVLRNLTQTRHNLYFFSSLYSSSYKKAPEKLEVVYRAICEWVDSSLAQGSFF